MNHVYRVVFNHALKCVQVVSEFARGRSSAASSAAARRAPLLTALSAAIALAGLAPSAFAAYPGWNEWRGTVDNDWGNAGNWALGEPSASDPEARATYIDSNRTAVVSATGEGTNHIHVGDTGIGTLVIQDGGQLTSNVIFMGTGEIAGTRGTADGRVTITGAGSTWTALRTIGVGHWGKGLVNIDDGGTLAIGTDAYIASGAGAVGVVNVTDAGSIFTTGQTLRLGHNGTGTVNVTGAGAMESAYGLVGENAGSVGLAVINGTDSRWLNRNSLVIGQAGNGTVRVEDGAEVEVRGAVAIANLGTSGSNRSQGTLQVSGSDTRFVQTAGTTTVGNAGVASIEVRNGGAVSFPGTVTFGVGTIGIGTALIADAGTTWDSGALRLGVSGYGRFDVREGAAATVRGSITLGESTNGMGYVLVGTDALLDIVGATPATITTGSNGMGWMELNGGTLRASSALRIDSETRLAGDAVLDAREAVLVRGTISGIGQLQKIGNGTLNLANVDNSQWTGGLRMEDGMLRVAGSQALGTGRVELADGTTLSLFDGVLLNNAVYLEGEAGMEVGGGESATLANASGASSAVLVKREAGTLTLTGGTFGESTRVEAGTLRVTGNALNGGDVDIGADGTFEIDTTRVLSYAGQFSGDGTLRQGRHFLTLTGDSSAFAGTTVVNGGLLDVQGSLGGLTQLENTALLTGTGTLGSVTLMGGSTLSPGSRLAGSIGQLSLTGDLVFDASAIFQVDVAADGSSDHVDVAGSAILGQANTVAVAAEGDWKASTRYTLLTAADGVNGTFAGASSNFAFLDPTLDYDANNVYLTLARNDVSMPDVELAFPDVVVNTNQKEVAAAVEDLRAGNAVYDAVVRLEVPQVVPAFDSLSGEVHAAHRGTLLQNRFLHDGIDRHLDGRAINAEVAPGVNVWLAGSGGQLRTDGTAENTATRVSQDGLMAGAGWQVGEALELGVAAGSQRLETRLQGRSALAKTDSTEYGVYAQYRWNGLSLRGGVTRADYRTDTTRAAQVGTTFAEDLVSREDATGTTAFVRAGWAFGGPRLQVTPEIELAQVRLESDGGQERGGHSALRLGAADSDYRTGLAALKADWDISGGQRDRAVLTARVGWQYAEGDRLPVADARFVEGTRDFTIAGTPLARSTALAQLGVAISPSANSRVSLQVQGRKGGEQREFGAQLDWSVAF